MLVRRREATQAARVVGMNNDTQHSPAVRCPHCDYQLTGLTESRCPECGKAFDLSELRRRAASPPPKPMRIIVSLLVVPVLVAGIWRILAVMVSAGGLAGNLAMVVFYGALLATPIAIIFAAIHFMLTIRRLYPRASRAGMGTSAGNAALLFLAALVFQLALILTISAVAYGEFRRSGLPVPMW